MKSSVFVQNFPINFRSKIDLDPTQALYLLVSERSTPLLLAPFGGGHKMRRQLSGELMALQLHLDQPWPNGPFMVPSKAPPLTAWLGMAASSWRTMVINLAMSLASMSSTDSSSLDFIDWNLVKSCPARISCMAAQ
ncbi:hypothetical protein JZ751_006807 [Albula glossodonta]|uniref:Uncharacterized protein n=1 Tax=Albula glossodonta TaxID=121402 RepID=A0A8T2P463_9TELE|nr:hypothetical protein JZ751_006807 [Albula glossodonta]